MTRLGLVHLLQGHCALPRIILFPKLVKDAWFPKIKRGKEPLNNTPKIVWNMYILFHMFI